MIDLLSLNRNIQTIDTLSSLVRYISNHFSRLMKNNKGETTMLIPHFLPTAWLKM